MVPNCSVLALYTHDTRSCNLLAGNLAITDNKL